MIIAVEKEVLSGDHIVTVDGTRAEIYADSKRGTINIPAFGPIASEQVDEVVEAIRIAKMLASGKLSLSEKPHWVTLSCTVPGMPHNSRGHVATEAFYKTEDGDICVDHHYCPRGSKPAEYETVILTRDSQGAFLLNAEDIDVTALPLKKKPEYPDVVTLC